MGFLLYLKNNEMFEIDFIAFFEIIDESLKAYGP